MIKLFEYFKEYKEKNTSSESGKRYKENFLYEKPLVELFVIFNPKIINNKILFKNINTGEYRFLPSKTSDYIYEPVIFNDEKKAKKFIEDREGMKLSILPLRA